MNMMNRRRSRVIGVQEKTIGSNEKKRGRFTIIWISFLTSNLSYDTSWREKRSKSQCHTRKVIASKS